MTAPHTILVADDEPGIRNLVGDVLKTAGYRVVFACDGSEAVAVLKAEHVDLALIDIVMPKHDGVEAIRQIRRDHPHLRIVAMTGAGGSLLDTLQRLGAEACLAKPFSPEAVETLIAQLLSP